MKIADKIYVALDYALTLDSGEEIDRSEEGSPLVFITGSGQILPGLEKRLMGMVAGDSAQITVEAEEGYGPKQDDLCQDIPRSQFPEDVEITKGMSFEAQGPNGPFLIEVASVNDNDTVTVDLNHPMAGKRLNFVITVVEVREPSEAEIASLNSECGDGCDCGGSCSPGDNNCSPSGCGEGCSC